MNFKIYLTANQFKNLKFALPKIVNHIEYIINIKKSANVRLLGKVDPTTGKITPLKGDLPYNLSDEVTPTAEEQHTTGEEHEKQKARVKLNKTQKINILIELGIYQHIYNKGYHGRQVEFLFADILDTTDRYVREVRTSSGKINQEFAKDYLEKLKNMKTEDLEKKSKNQ
ncbi:hypothetical protein [Bergeyella sp. RCAD1439]|uniref:hypothetical protein n=1 Tax=Bergeyella anatis TaxID=3113737 RepID=UPI002E187088|nr:hypothetical protein [Bergeyella sp. RCAD1439]